MTAATGRRCPEEVAEYLPRLDAAVISLLDRRYIATTIQRLKQEVRTSAEPFVWSSIDIGGLRPALPETVRSGWIFVLKDDVWSGAHFHPNSIQHMVVLEGQGWSKIAGITKRVVRFGATSTNAKDHWCIIDRGVTHEFRPAGGDMVVLSFHTCEASELIETSSMTGASRHYQLEG